MKRTAFPWIALGLGLVIALVLFQTGATGPEEARLLPLLTLLLMSEFGFLVTAFGAFFALKSLAGATFSVAMVLITAACMVLAAGFTWLGFTLWPGALAG